MVEAGDDRSALAAANVVSGDRGVETGIGHGAGDESEHLLTIDDTEGFNATDRTKEVIFVHSLFFSFPEDSKARIRFAGPMICGVFCFFIYQSRPPAVEASPFAESRLL